MAGKLVEVWSQRRRPDGLVEVDEVMTNADHSIEPGAEARLAEAPVFGQYSGWNFCGYAWFEGGLFHCEVWRFGQYVETASAASLVRIMEEVSQRYGYD